MFLITRSIEAARRVARVDRNVLEIPGAGLGAESKVGKPAPGQHASVPGKPRHLDVSLHAHAVDIGIPRHLSEATLCRLGI